MPARRVFSMARRACNMAAFLPELDISKSRSGSGSSQHVPPEDVPLLALKYGCGIDCVYLQRANDLGRVRHRHLQEAKNWIEDRVVRRIYHL